MNIRQYKKYYNTKYWLYIVFKSLKVDDAKYIPKGNNKGCIHLWNETHRANKIVNY